MFEVCRRRGWIFIFDIEFALAKFFFEEEEELPRCNNGCAVLFAERQSAELQMYCVQLSWKFSRWNAARWKSWGWIWYFFNIATWGERCELGRSLEGERFLVLFAGNFACDVLERVDLPSDASSAVESVLRCDLCGMSDVERMEFLENFEACGRSGNRGETEKRKMSV